MPRNQVTTDELHAFKREQLDRLDQLAELRITEELDTNQRAYELGADSAVRDVLRRLEELYMAPEPEHGQEDLRDPRAKLKERAEKIKGGGIKAQSDDGEFDGEVTIHFDKPGDLPGAYPPVTNRSRAIKIVAQSGDHPRGGRPIKDQPQA